MAGSKILSIAGNEILLIPVASFTHTYTGLDSNWNIVLVANTHRGECVNTHRGS